MEKAQPEMGEYQGKPINLAHAEATLTPAELAEVVVDIPGRGKVRPWRFVQPPGEGGVDADGATLI